MLTRIAAVTVTVTMFACDADNDGNCGCACDRDCGWDWDCECGLVQPDAEKQFMRVKAAYQALTEPSSSRSSRASSSSSTSSSSSSWGRVDFDFDLYGRKKEQEDFYSFGAWQAGSGSRFLVTFVSRVLGLRFSSSSSASSSSPFPSPPSSSFSSFSNPINLNVIRNGICFSLAEDFFRDLASDLETRKKEGTPKSLWQELAVSRAHPMHTYAVHCTVQYCNVLLRYSTMLHCATLY